MPRVLYEFGPFRLDPAGRRLLRLGAVVVLTPKVFDALLVLVEHHGQSLTRAELIARIWPGTSVGEHNLNQSIAVLRKVLDDNPRQPDYIATLPGRGYSFIAQVRCEEVRRDRVRGNEIRPEEVRRGEVGPEEVGEKGNASGDRRLDPAVVAAAGSLTSPPPRIHPTTPKRWRYAARGVAVLALIVAVIAISPLGSRTRHLAQSMTRSQFSSALPHSVSVLPFEDLDSSSDTEKQYIAPGLTQELTAELARLHGLKVIVGRLLPASASVPNLANNSSANSRTASAPSSLTATLDPKSAGRSLNVDSLLQGSVRRSGAQYRIAVQLINCRDGRELWSGVYTADVSDIPSVEEQIVHHTADALRVPWSSSIDEQWARRHVENPEAHDLYLQARYLWNTRTPEAVGRSIVLLQQAIAKDPSYARAYAGLADCYAVMAANQQMPVATAVPLARDAASKALRLDPTLAEPHATLGLLKSKFDWDFEGAQEEFQRSLALNPGYATAHHWAGLNLTAVGQFEAADAELRKAEELDPLSRIISEGLFENYYFWHHFDEAIQAIRAFQARNPSEYAGLFSDAIGDAYLAKGMYPEGEASYRQMQQYNDNYLLHLVKARALEGHRTEVRATLERIEHKHDSSFGPALLARAYMAMGERDIAIARLQQACLERDPDVVIIKYDPDFAPLSNDPRFEHLVESIGPPHDQAEATNH
jgi:DNA-binding winged helix-turn-helix (wHTH) protein/TolB-like protein/tetratricopeptide (TPR) repeat protein